MIALDTSALLAIFRLEREADTFLKAIVAAEGRVISAFTVLETSAIMTRGSWREGSSVPFDEFLTEAGIQVVPLDGPQARIARNAFLRFGKGRHPAALDLGDCVSYALAKARTIPLLFKGSGLAQTDIIPALPLLSAQSARGLLRASRADERS